MLPYHFIHCHKVTPTVDTHQSSERSEAEHHHYHEMIFVLKGDYHLMRDDETTEAVLPSHMLLIPAEVRHSTIMPRDGSTSLMVIQWEGKFPLSASQTPGVFPDKDGTVRHCLNWLHNLGKQTDYNQLQQDSY